MAARASSLLDKKVCMPQFAARLEYACETSMNADKVFRPSVTAVSARNIHPCFELEELLTLRKHVLGDRDVPDKAGVQWPSALAIKWARNELATMTKSTSLCLPRLLHLLLDSISCDGFFRIRRDNKEEKTQLADTVSHLRTNIETELLDCEDVSFFLFTFAEESADAIVPANREEGNLGYFLANLALGETSDIFCLFWRLWFGHQQAETTSLFHAKLALFVHAEDLLHPLPRGRGKESKLTAYEYASVIQTIAFANHNREIEFDKARHFFRVFGNRHDLLRTRLQRATSAILIRLPGRDASIAFELFWGTSSRQMEQSIKKPKPSQAFWIEYAPSRIDSACLLPVPVCMDRGDLKTPIATLFEPASVVWFAFATPSIVMRKRENVYHKHPIAYLPPRHKQAEGWYMYVNDYVFLGPFANLVELWKDVSKQQGIETSRDALIASPLSQHLRRVDVSK